MNEHGILYMIWQGNTGLGRVFTLLLLGLGGAAAYVAARHIRRYRAHEAAALDSVRAALARERAKEAPAEEGAAETDDDEAAAVLPRPRPPVVPVDALRTSAPADSLIGDRLAELGRMKQARVRVTVDALQQMTVMRENARAGLAFPGYAVDLCTMGGMLGTFIGLCMMLLQMQGVAPGDGVPAAGGFAQASASLGAIIASKKTAFVTTLVGLSCAIALSLLNFLLVRAQSAFYDALERFTAAELLPATVPAEEDETVMEKLSLQLAESFARLGDITRIQERSGELQTAMQEAMSETVASIRSLALVAAARGPDSEAGGALAALIKQVADNNAAVVRTIENVARTARGSEVRSSPRPDGWGALGSQVGGLLADVVGQLRRNPVLALGGVAGAVMLAKLLF